MYNVDNILNLIIKSYFRCTSPSDMKRNNAAIEISKKDGYLLYFVYILCINEMTSIHGIYIVNISPLKG